MKRFDRSKTHANIGTIGHVGHGQTSLTEAIAQVLSSHVKRREYAEALEKCSDDFNTLDEDSNWSPADFLQRWQKQGIKVPTDLHEFLQFFSEVVNLANKKQKGE